MLSGRLKYGLFNVNILDVARWTRALYQRVAHVIQTKDYLGVLTTSPYFSEYLLIARVWRKGHYVKESILPPTVEN